MSAAPKASREVPVGDSGTSLQMFEDFAMLYKKGVECAAEIQSRSIDCAVQQNKAAMDLWNQTVEKLPWAPRMNPFEGLGGSLERLGEAQKATMKLAVDQTRVFVDLVKERTASAGRSMDSLSKFAQQGFEQSLAAQKKVAEAAVAETKSAIQGARQRFGVPGDEMLAESIRQGVETILDAQKDLLATASSRWTPERETVPAS